MVKSNLENWTKTYIAEDLNTNKNLIVKLYEWNKTNNLNLSLIDDDEIIQASDSTLCCKIKKSIREQLNLSKTFVLIVGKQTSTVRNGVCFVCPFYRNYLARPNNCSQGNSIDERSYVQYECEKAVKDFNAGFLRNIVVIYNGHKTPKRDKCPEVIRWKGIHIGSDSLDEQGEISWNYQEIIDAILQK